MSIKRLLSRFSLESDQLELSHKALIFVLFRVGAMLLGYLFTYLTIAYYGNSVYSMVILAFTLLTILTIVTKLGYDVTLTRYVALGKFTHIEISSYLSKAKIRAFGFSTICAIAIYVGREWLATSVFNSPGFENYLFWAALTLPPWTLIFLHNGMYRGMRNNTLFSFYTAFGRFLLTIILLLSGYYLLSRQNAELPIIVHCIAITLLFLSCCWISYRHFGYSIHPSVAIKFNTFARESRPILVTSIAGILLVWVDRLLIGIFMEESNVGIYDVGAKLALLVSFNLEAVNSILAPKIVNLYREKDVGKLQSLLSFTVKISSAISIMVFIFLLIFKDFILGLFGAKFLEAGMIIIILSAGQIFSCICGSVGNILQMTGNQDFHQKIMIIGLMVNLILNILLINNFGLNGVAIATVAGLLTWNLLGAIYIKRKLGVRCYLKLW